MSEKARPEGSLRRSHSAAGRSRRRGEGSLGAPSATEETCWALSASRTPGLEKTQLSKLLHHRVLCTGVGGGAGGKPAGPTGRGPLETSGHNRSGDGTDSGQPGTEFLAPGRLPDPQGQWSELTPLLHTPGPFQKIQNLFQFIVHLLPPALQTYPLAG